MRNSLSAEHRNWVNDLIELRNDCEGSPECDCEKLAVRLFQAICVAPAPIHTLLGSQCEKHFFEQCIDAQAFECAVLAVLGDRTGYMISRSPQGDYAATLHLPNWVDEFTFHSGSLCLALVGAMSGALSHILVDSPAAIIELAESQVN